MEDRRRGEEREGCPERREERKGERRVFVKGSQAIVGRDDGVVWCGVVVGICI